MGISNEFSRIVTVMWLCQVFCLSLNVGRSDANTHDIYLNSLAHCGHMARFRVSKQDDYLIRPSKNPESRTHNFHDCEVTFYSSTSDGHICLIQEGREAKILDDNVELKIYDGLSNEDNVIGHLKPFNDRLTVRDVCSSQPYISLYMYAIQKETTADIRKVQFVFRIVDISSPKRTLYLDGMYCDSKYDLSNSLISLRNRPKFQGLAVSPLKSDCAMMFKKVNPNSNNTLCLVYIPSSNVTCGSQWLLEVSTDDFENYDKHQHIVYNLHCNDSKAKEMHVWCGSKNHLFITLVYYRDKTVMSNSTLERPGEFRYIVADYEGTPESLLEKVRASLVVVEFARIGTTEIILICVSVALVIFLIVILYMNRQKLPCYNYTAVEKREPQNV